MSEKENLNQYQDSYESDFKFNDENHAILQWYAQKIIENKSSLSKIKILSLGIGHHTVSRTIIEQFKTKLDQYIIIEGSKDIIDNYVLQHKPGENVDIVNSYFEDYVPDIKFDIIEMGFVLEHVVDPLRIVKKYRKMLKKNGRMYIAVPNARSLHRLIGHEAGLLADLYELSKHDLQLGHKRYFDLESIKDLVVKAGLKIVKTEGVLLKPITTDQIKKLQFSRNIINALFKIGISYPELSNAIMIETKNK